MVSELLRAFLLIFIAEMGDKTQILAMAFATKYKIRNVILGVFLGSFLNHALAVLLGSSLSYIVPLNTLSIIAGFSFVLFGVWNLKIEGADEERKKGSKYGPTLTVALAFFIGELGDKTQLTAITLATDASYPMFILMGTVLGMVFTSLIGILIGIKLGNKIPDLYIKVGASIIFFVFGYLKLFSSLPSSYTTIAYTMPFTLLIIVTSYALILPGYRLRKLGMLSSYKKTAQDLFNYYNHIYEHLEDICLSEGVCGVCNGKDCIVGYTKGILNKIKNKEKVVVTYFSEMDFSKEYDRLKVLESLKHVLLLLDDDEQSIDKDGVNEIRRSLEMIIFKDHINEYINRETYLKEIMKKDKFCYDILKQVKTI